MNHRKLLSALLALTLALSLALPAFAAEADALARGEYAAALFEQSGAGDAQGAPDYNDAANWAYYGLGEDSGVDVFLICPTVDTVSERNSLDLNDALKGNFLYALDLEKGIYEDAGRLFSPYYRQMSMNAYRLSAAERAQAQELAYRDVSASFRWYLDHENGGRGVILAGFSQGAQMCLELLKEYYGGDAAEAVSLRGGLVAVYAIGWSVTEEMAEAYPQIVPAKGETDTGVVVSFDCEDGTLSDTLVIPAGTKALSINPLSWRTDGARADKSLNRGAVMSAGAEPVPALCGAYLGARGELVVTDVSAAEYPAVIDIFPDGSFHIYDYLFFFTNLKENVAARTAAWRERAPETILAGMSVEEKIAQMLMPSFRYYPDENGERQNVTALPADVAAVLEKHGFAGVVLFSQNTADTAKAVKLVDDMQKANAAGRNRTQLLIAIDQEGGRVTRLGHGTQMPGNMALGAANDTAVTAAAASVIGQELMSMGVNFNFAPVLDVNSNPANPVIGTRSFSDDASIVAAQGVSYMRALQDSGAISTLKHFPGHGDTATDSHTGLPLVDRSYEELKARELIPFRAAIDAGAEAVMTAHIQYPQIETGKYTSKLTGERVCLPATLSGTILTDILRGDMGFDGVVITDAMDMDAVAKHFDPYDAAKLAIEAGVDIVLMPADTSTPEGLAGLDAYIQKLAGFVKSGEISEEKVNAAVLRVLRLKEAHGLTKAYAGVDADASKTVGSAAHHETEWELTKKTVTLVKNENGTLPLTRENQKIAVLTAYDNEVLSMEYAIGRLRDEGKLARGTEITVQSIQKKTAEEAIACAAGAEHVVIITELGSAAGLNNDTAKTVDALIESVHRSGGDAIILSCSLPYDAARYQAADAIVLAWSARGMSEDPRVTDGAAAQYGPSMPAALYLMLSPDETPAGTLPVDVPKLTAERAYSGEVLYPRGFGLRYPTATREYAAAAFVTAAGIEGSGGTQALSAYTDADEVGAEYAPALAAAVERGVIRGYEDRTLRPGDGISRAEAFVMLSRCLPELEKLSPAAAFSDVPDWAKDDVDRLSAAGLVLGYGDGTLGASDALSMEQVRILTERIAQTVRSNASAAAESGLHAAAQPKTASPDWVAALPSAQDKDVRQLFVVAGMGMDKTTATISLHERGADGRWRQILSTPGYVGRNGLCLDKDHAEGCGQTPVGVYHFNRAFGIADDPGCAIPYTKVTEDTWWSGDQRKGMRYNEMVSRRDYPDLDTENSEHIVDYEYQYQYCLNISFNEEGTPGRGSAIFLHCFGPTKPYTGGCVAVPEYSMKQIMQAVRPDCAVVIDTLENLGGSL